VIIGTSTEAPAANRAATGATPLARTAAEFPTDTWNDSCSVSELTEAIADGATGATANPTIVHDVWKADPARWSGRVVELAKDHPTWTEADLAWAIVDEMSLAGAVLLEPIFDAHGGRKGRLSIQTNPTLFRDPDAMLAQARRFDSLARNVIVKFPATRAGIEAMEEASFEGISINATVSFSVAQAVAAAEAVERGIRRRESAGQPTDSMGPVITIMMGRIEDWLRVAVDRDGITVDPDALPWSGVAVFKRAYGIFGERGFRARLLGAAIRHHRHWSDLIGGDVGITLPLAWRRRFNASDVEVRARMADPVDPSIVDDLARHLPDFRRAYEPDGLSINEFDAWPPTVRTLRAFIASYHDLLHAVSDALLPNPDGRR
jgi:transaldolase